MQFPPWPVMVWQELIDHVNDTTVKVESKSGKRYPVTVEKQYMADAIYKQFMNEAHDDEPAYEQTYPGYDGYVTLLFCDECSKF